MTDRGLDYELMNRNEKETDNNEQTGYKKSTGGSIDEELTLIEEREIPGDATRRRVHPQREIAASMANKIQTVTPDPNPRKPNILYKNAQSLPKLAPRSCSLKEKREESFKKGRKIQTPGDDRRNRLRSPANSTGSGFRTSFL